MELLGRCSDQGAAIYLQVSYLTRTRPAGRIEQMLKAMFWLLLSCSLHTLGAATVRPVKWLIKPQISVFHLFHVLYYYFFRLTNSLLASQGTHWFGVFLKCSQALTFTSHCFLSTKQTHECLYCDTKCYCHPTHTGEYGWQSEKM